MVRAYGGVVLSAVLGGAGCGRVGVGLDGSGGKELVWKKCNPNESMSFNCRAVQMDGTFGLSLLQN